MADFKAKLNTLRRFILDLVFPAFCLGCKSEGVFLCRGCSDAIPKLPAVPEGRPECGPFLDSLISVSKYEDNSLLARAIHEFKYEFIKDLAGPLSGLLIGLLKEAPFRDFVICPVPLHPKRMRWRGYNQSALLAEPVAGALGRRVLHLLERTSFSRPQMELTQTERMQNVLGAFRCIAGPPAKVLLIDDVATTRSTLNACAKALKEAGALKVCGIVLARTI